MLVSLGTVTRDAGGRFLRVAVEALDSLAHRLQAIVVAPPGTVNAATNGVAEFGEFGPDVARGDIKGDIKGGAVRNHVLLLPYVPQVELMPRLSAVVSHGGNNTVCEALAHGVPLVVAPVRDDQPIIGEQVVRAGAGLRVRFGRVSAPALRESILSVLDDSSFRTAAGRLREDFTTAGGVKAAADHLLKMV